MDFYHEPVLVEEVLEALAIRPGGIYVDATLGGGGHAWHILEALGSGRLIGIDQDWQALEAAKDHLKEKQAQLSLLHGNFRHLADLLQSIQVEAVDGILMDIGVSSWQIDAKERGFSYQVDGPLDMRMDQRAEQPSAKDLVNELSAEELSKIFYQYGEERWSRRIAQFIVDERKRSPLETSFDLVRVINKAIPKKVRMQDKHPARRVFQALRIAVNQELEALEAALDQALPLLKSGGRLAVISFHSLEDRMVKTKFREWSTEIIPPPGFPAEMGRPKKARLLSRKPITAGPEEVQRNPRAHSAKLRVVEKV